MVLVEFGIFKLKITFFMIIYKYKEDKMNNQEKILQRFCKDYAIPITLFSQPYFSHFIEVLDPLLDTHKKLKMLYVTLQEFESADDFLSEGSRISKEVINLIQNTKGFEKFKNMEKTAFNIPSIANATVYDKANQGKDFISIDLKKANFNSLQLLGIHDDLGIYHYEDLVGKFSDQEYFQKSKMLRQVIFGDESMEPKKQQRIQKFVVHHLYEILMKEGFNVLGATADEIIIKDCKDIERVKNVLTEAPDNMKFFRVESFTLKVLGNKPYFVKILTDESGNKKEEFKSVPNQYIAQAVRIHLNQPLQENDLVFNFEGIPAKMLYSIFDELNIESKKHIKPQ